MARERCSLSFIFVRLVVLSLCRMAPWYTSRTVEPPSLLSLMYKLTTLKERVKTSLEVSPLAQTALAGVRNHCSKLLKAASTIFAR